MAERAYVSALAVAFVATCAGFADAQPKTDALAESLFNEGRALIRAGKVAEGCAKLEESARLDQASGTVLSVADCREKLGRTASAWADYKSALELAQRAKRPDRVALAKKKIEELEPKVPYLVLAPPRDKILGLKVTIDGTELTEQALGTRLALDEGSHSIVATAPGYQPVSLDVTLSTGKETAAILGPFVRLPAKTPPARAWVAPAWVLPTAIVSGSVSVISFGVGAGTGGRAIELGGLVAEECPNRSCSELGFSSYEEGVTMANVSNATIGIGAGLAAASIAFTVLFFTLDSAAPSEPHVAATRDGLAVVF